ncbi:hypothetical protein ERO13_D05G238566v2 [Gossypium hirsutum]|uniref:Uncharacterized protein n=2 Tax=Gossypium TaxID=3633 RepID=A0A5D2V0M8_GOSMU|nr:hypothetical protein ERO13_D05G238566v2 [Gossypium hirsutum]TYH72511.1 hypothetical protein ES332_D05G259900v1 [Gossypium tomentosum]TYI82896.1 hypothetical protein E1A91_D05G253300v1 [Gossypium mustelinum]
MEEDKNANGPSYVEFLFQASSTTVGFTSSDGNWRSKAAHKHYNFISYINYLFPGTPILS